MVHRVAALALLAAALLAAPSEAAEEPPLAIVGAPIAPDGIAAASVFHPAHVTATFRVPRADTALYVATQWYVRDLSVTIVGPAGQRRTIIAQPDLPGHMLGLRLPSDAWRADRVELDESVVRASAPPYLMTAEAFASIGWRSWWYQAFFGLFLGLALVHGMLAVTLRSRAFGRYTIVMLAQAAILLPWLGIARPPPEISQPLHAVLQSVIFAGLTLFTIAFFERARLPRYVLIALWSLVAVNISTVWGDDVLQDLYPVPELATQVITTAMYLAFVAAGVFGVRRRVDGAWYYIAGTALSAAGFVCSEFLPPRYDPVVQSLPMLGSGLEALLLALALSLRLRRQERERVKLERLVSVDGLTGIANRTALDERLPDAWETARREGQPLAVLMVDVDHFKAYNDTYGHLAGDRVLRHIARALEESAKRDNDLVARYGGEEFVVLLPGADRDGAQVIAARLLDAIDRLQIEHGGVQSKRLTVSIGVASVVPIRPGDGSELVRRADTALYVAKSTGRNRVVVDEPGGAPVAAG